MEFMGCGEAAGPNPDQSPELILGRTALGPAARSLTRRSHPAPGLLLGSGGRAPQGKRPRPPTDPSPLPRALSQARSPARAPPSLRPPGQERAAGAQRRGRGRGSCPAPAGVPTPQLQRRGSGSGAQAVPGGGALEPGLEFLPTAPAAS